jgi:hypothetical protein
VLETPCSQYHQPDLGRLWQENYITNYLSFHFPCPYLYYLEVRIMYTVDCKITGVSPLMQHRFPMPEFENIGKGGKKSTGEKDYSQEWREYFYATSDGQIYQPSDHIQGAMVKAAVNFKVQGKRGKTYKDLISAALIVTPDQIPHVGYIIPDTLDADADKPLYIDARPVVIQRARQVRLRPTFKAGWELEFEIMVIDDELPSNVVQDVLTLAGKAVGIGDFRPRFGRFNVARFEVTK